MKALYSATVLGIITIALLIMLTATSMFAQTPLAIPYMTSVFAGGGTTTFSGSGGTACPHGGYTATDAMGDGCLATDAVLYEPWAVVFDSSGNAYIADSNSSSYAYVRKIDAITGVISLFAGGLSAPESGSPCASYSANGDTGADLAITSLSYASATEGDGCPGVNPATAAPYSYLDGIRDLAIDASSTYLYIDDYSAGRIRRISLSNAALSGRYYAHELEPVAGASASGWNGDGAIATTKLKNPTAIALDAKGDLFIADQSGNAIREVSAGDITTVANWTSSTTTAPTASCAGFDPAGGTKSLHVDSVYDLNFDAKGNLYMGEKGCCSVRMIAPNASSGVVDGTTTMSTLYGDGQTDCTAHSGAWYQAYSDTSDSSVRSAIPVEGGNLYVLTASAGWFYDAGDTANGATNGWLHNFLYNTANGCATNETSPYVGCPAPEATFKGSSYGAHGSVDQYGNLYIADGGSNIITKFAIGLDFEGTAPQVQVEPVSPVTNTVLIHGAGISDSVVSTSAPFSLEGILTYPAGGPYTSDCSTYNNTTHPSDDATDCVYSVTYTSTENGLQNGVLSANGASLPLNGYGTHLEAASVTALDKVYDGTNVEPTSSVSCKLTPEVAGLTCAASFATFAQSNVGSGITVTATGITLSGPGASTYKLLSTTATTTANIDQATPFLSAACPSVSYNAKAQMTCTGTATGVAGVTVPGSFAFSPGSETGNPASATTYTETSIFTSNDPNYVSGGTVNAQFTINAAEPIFCTSLPSPVTYGDTLPSITCNSVAGAKLIWTITGPVTVTAGAESNGSQTMGLTITGAGNIRVGVKQLVSTTAPIAPAYTTSTSVLVNPMQVTITANSFPWIYGYKEPAFSFIPVTMAYKDAQPIVTYSVYDPARNGSMTKNSALGTYSIIPLAKKNPNYAFQYGDGILTYKANGSLLVSSILSGTPQVFKDTFLGNTSKAINVVLTNKSGVIVSYTATLNTANFNVMNTNKNSPEWETNTCTAARGVVCTFAITFVPQTLGPLSDTLTIAVSDQDDLGNSDPGFAGLPTNFTYPVSGNGVGTFSATLNIDPFPNANNGMTSSDSIAVTNNTGWPMQVTKVTSTSKYFVVPALGTTGGNNCGSQLANGGTCTIPVTFAPVAGRAPDSGANPFVGVVNVLATATTTTGTSTAKDKLTSQPVDVSASDVQWINYKPADGSPLTLAGYLGRTVTQTIVVTNDTDLPLTIDDDSLTVVGPYTATSACHDTGSASTCKITVTWTVTVGGASGALYIGDGFTYPSYKLVGVVK